DREWTACVRGMVYGSAVCRDGYEQLRVWILSRMDAALVSPTHKRGSPAEYPRLTMIDHRISINAPPFTRHDSYFFPATARTLCVCLRARPNPDSSLWRRL